MDFSSISQDPVETVEKLWNPLKPGGFLSARISAEPDRIGLSRSRKISTRPLNVDAHLASSGLAMSGFGSSSSIEAVSQKER
jgi:hypothetical protein